MNKNDSERVSLYNNKFFKQYADIAQLQPYCWIIISSETTQPRINMAIIAGLEGRHEVTGS
jgi:hypothetical protein